MISATAVIVPMLLIGLFMMIRAFYKRKEDRAKYPAAKKPKKDEIKKYVYIDEIEQSIS